MAPDNQFYLLHAHSAIHIIESLTDCLETFDHGFPSLKYLAGITHNGIKSDDHRCFVRDFGNRDTGLSQEGAYVIELIVHEKTPLMANFQRFLSALAGHLNQGEILENEEVRTTITSIKIKSVPRQSDPLVKMNVAVTYVVEAKESQ